MARAGGGERITAVVASRDRPHHLEVALAALVRAARDGDDVVVVDSASTGRGVAEVAAAFDVRCLRCDAPGVSRARNAGFGAATSPLVAFTDDDCVVDPDWFEVAATACTDDATGFVTGQVLPDREIATLLSVLVDTTPRWFERDGVDDAIGHGANMVWRRAALADIGGFDERLGPGAPLRYAEEHDAFWRARRAGWRGRYEPELRVVHRQWRGRLAYVRTNWGYGFGSGALAAKVRRLDPANGRRLVRRVLWEDGAARAWHELRAGHEAGAAASAAKAIGAVGGLLRGRGTPVDPDGHFRRPS